MFLLKWCKGIKNESVSTGKWGGSEGGILPFLVMALNLIKNIPCFFCYILAAEQSAVSAVPRVCVCVCVCHTLQKVAYLRRDHTPANIKGND